MDLPSIFFYEEIICPSITGLMQMCHTHTSCMDLCLSLTHTLHRHYTDVVNIKNFILKNVSFTVLHQHFLVFFFQAKVVKNTTLVPFRLSQIYIHTSNQSSVQASIGYICGELAKPSSAPMKPNVTRTWKVKLATLKPQITHKMINFTALESRFD